MFNILDIVPGTPRISIVDVGAMSVGEEEPYAPLLKLGIADVIGFEPVQAECNRLNAISNGRRTYLPYCIGDGRTATFHECNYPMTSSLYEPDTPLLSKFQNLENLVRVVKKETVQTRRLDDIPEATGADYLKLDVQGAELDVFRGAVRLLEHVVVVHTEVEFLPLYKNQPLFAEVDQLLRKSGFAFHRFLRIAGRTFKPLLSGNDVNASPSQQLWADVLYVKNFMQLSELSREKLLKLAVILHEIYRSYDLCALVLQQYDVVSGTALANRYLSRLVQTSGG